MKKRYIFCLILVFSACVNVCFAGVWPGTPSQWHGFDRYDFRYDGRPCIVVTPKEAASHNPWVWRARFFGHEPQADVALLEKGFHVVYMDVADMFGSPKATAHWDAFYKYLTESHNFNPKAALEGMSRGGLIIYNWAAANPERVACIYGDNPVCDFKSWPAGKGKGKYHQPSWQACQDAYGFSEDQAIAYKHNPIDNLEPLASAMVPLLHVCGTADSVVPVAENTDIIEKRYRQLGGRIIVIRKPGLDHHPHSLKDPKPIVDFITSHTSPLKQKTYSNLRGGLDNCRLVFERTGKGRVAFLGGSITYNTGWRMMVCEELQRRFPDTKFDFIAAGIPSTGSTPGAFRLTRDVFEHGTVDLLFEEAAVNDSSNGRTDTEQLRAMEGIVRHSRLINPNIDIVMMHFVDPSKIADYNKGKVPAVIVNHDSVAAHYNVPSINLALEVTERIGRGEFTWKGDFRNLHPSRFGQRLYFKAINSLFDAAWPGVLSGSDKVKAYALPGKKDEFCYDQGSLMPVTAAAKLNGFKVDPKWVNTVGGGTRNGFVNVPMLIGTAAGDSLKFAFDGSAVGIFVAAGPDAGVIEYRIDNGKWKKQDLFTRWSRGLHIPWLHVLNAELPGGEHLLELRIAKDRNKNSKGNACRIVHFSVNANSTTNEDALMSKARELAKKYLIVDTHTDVPYRLHMEMEDVSVRTQGGDFDYVRACQGGLDAVFMAAYVSPEHEDDGSAKELADEMLDIVSGLKKRWPDKFELAKSAGQVKRSGGNSRVLVVMSIENGAPIEGRLQNVDYFYDLGVRCITLVHSKANHICDSSFDTTRRWKGISPFGRQVVKRMNELGMIIDVSHMSDEAFWETLKISKSPVIASHSGCRHFTPGWMRNMSDEMIKALAEKGGVIQINFGAMFLNTNDNKKFQARMEHWQAIRDKGLEGDDKQAYIDKYLTVRPVYESSVADVANHIDHAVKLVGIDHVGIGSDFDGVGDAVPAGLEDVSCYPNLICELLKRGYSENDIAKICGGNFLRVWKSIELSAADGQL
ncbi:MAG: membrane dipeptidase [Anaerohalosphaera sp.]|nr:membrane dipeptidase [Anaerohalosphaera sp.]